MKSEADIIKELTAVLLDPNAYERLKEIVYGEAQAGISRSAMLKILEALRSTVTDDIEDQILEVMDFIAGFCPPHKTIPFNIE